MLLSFYLIENAFLFLTNVLNILLGKTMESNQGQLKVNQKPDWKFGEKKSENSFKPKNT